MEPWQRDHITRNFPKLIENTKCSAIFLAALISKNVLSEKDLQEIEATVPVSDKALKLYRILMTRKGGYEALLDCLKISKQTGALIILLQAGAGPSTAVSLPKSHVSAKVEEFPQMDLKNKKIDEIVQILNDFLLQYETEAVTKTRETILEAARTNLPRVQFPHTDVPFPDDKYKLPKTESKGLFLIINILLFDYQPHRLDANIDTLGLTTTFTSLGYHIYSCEVTSIHWTKQVFFDIVEAFKRECCEQKVDSFGVFLGSHGSLGYLQLFSENDGVYLNDAIEMLCTRKDADRHPNWDEIPKMFFLQVCREEEDSPDVDKALAKNCLMSFACRRGQRAYRGDRGSVYVKHLVDNLANFASKEDLFRILERTREGVESEMMQEASTVQEPEHYGYNFETLYFNMVSNAT